MDEGAKFADGWETPVIGSRENERLTVFFCVHPGLLLVGRGGLPEQPGGVVFPPRRHGIAGVSEAPIGTWLDRFLIVAARVVPVQCVLITIGVVVAITAFGRHYSVDLCRYTLTLTVVLQFFFLHAGVVVVDLAVETGAARVHVADASARSIDTVLRRATGIASFSGLPT